jgi:phage/plasmid-associated DNA primase
MIMDTETNVFNSFKSYEEFDKVWNDTINSEEIGNKFSINSIAFWAQMDSPSKFSSHNDKLLITMMNKHVSDIINLGELDQKQFAEYLYCRFGHEFVSYTQVKRNVYWCEFVLPRTNDKKPGQLYKWRYLGNQPDGLSLFLNKLSDIVKIVLSEMRSVMASLTPDKDNKDDEILYKTLKSHMSALIKSSKKLNGFNYKQGVISEAGVLFKKNVFMEQMDQDANIMGVGNGVLEFCKGQAKLITHYHMYPISKYSPTKYVEYNPECSYVKTVWKMLKSLVPDDEYDALEFLLYYFSTSLDGYLKESLFLIIHGGGSNGKSVLLDILSKTIGSDYAVKLPLSYITEQSRNKAANADPATMLLEHSRLTYFSESDRNEKVNVAIVKEISGGEPLTGRKLYEDLKTFTPKTNYVLTTNHLLSIETQEYAVWRRFMSYSFKICFKNNADPNNKFERERDDDLITKIKNDGRYLSAMMSILVEYRRKLYDEYDGKLMKVPRPTIIKETEEYRQKEDIFARYISQRVFYVPDRIQTLDEICVQFRTYYRSENGGVQYAAKTQELIQIFKNTVLAKHIRDRDGIPILVDFWAIGDNEPIQPGMISYSEWEKRNNN